MGRIADEVIEQVRDSADIVGIIGETVALKRTGADYRGPCPFHGGTHRNFSVNPKRSSYYCFVCHEKGDVFSFVMKHAGLDYPGAVREVARRTGIVIPDEKSSSNADPREPLFEAIAVAQDWYAKRLLEDPLAGIARDYLEGRKIPLAAAGELGLGFAPPGRAFIDALSALGISEDRLVQAGLIIRRDDGSIAPRFRARLLFPIHDLRGRAVGFGGRILADAEPKYLNSPETPIFRKGTLLYNLHSAKHAIRKEQTAIVVEGYFDVIRMTLAGIENVVAPLGTAMTAEQSTLLAKFAKKAVLLYDSDQAGLKATFRSGDELLRNSVQVHVATLPPGEDPDTIILRSGVATLASVVRNAKDLMERKLQLLEERGWLTDLRRRRSALDKLLPSIRAAKDQVTRDLYLAWVSARTEVSRETLIQEVDLLPTLSVQHPRQSSVLVRVPQSEADPWRKPDLVAERNLIYIMMTSTTWLERASEEVPLDWFRCTEYAEIYSMLLKAKDSGEVMPPWESLSARARMASTLLKNEETFAGLDVDLTYVGCCLALQARPLIEDYKELTVKLRAARDEQRREELLSEREHLREDISTRFPLDWLKHTYRKSFAPKPTKHAASSRPIVPPASQQRNVS